MSDTKPKEKQPKVKLGANYWKLWTSSVISNLGDGVTAIALPWLSTAVTRNPLLIAAIGIAGRIPWLIFTLPAGVITDRVDRRKLMWWSQMFRALLMAGGAMIVVAYQSGLPDPAAVQEGATTENMVVYGMILVVSLLFGMAEVLYDNSAQTIIPSIVEPEGLERANGNLWGAEMVMNSFVGPPLGSLLIGFAFAYPFFFDGGTFVIAAVLIYLLTGTFKTPSATDDKPKKVNWWGEIKEGVKWLWAHPLLRPMAIILGLMNGIFQITGATFVLFAQEVLGTNAFLFAVLGTAGAVGGIVGSWLAPRISQSLGSGSSLQVTFLLSIGSFLIMGFATHWTLAWAMFAAGTFGAVLWNVITVSLRQTIIPDELLGRVNSVYRFFAWGMMPIGLAVGGGLVSLAEALGAGRVTALRTPWWFAGTSFILLFIYAAPKLTTEKMEAAREAGIAAKQEDPAEDADAE